RRSAGACRRPSPKQPRGRRNERFAVSPRGRMPPPLAGGAKGTVAEGLRALRGLIPYLWPRDGWELRLRVVAALALLAGGKLVNIAVPFLYKHAVDTLSGKYGLVVAPVMLIVAYGLARVCAQGFGELRDAVFAKVEQRAIRRLALSTFR